MAQMLTPTPLTLGTPRMKLKICLVGEGAAGKTSLIQRFVYDAFQDRYVATLGAKVTKKLLQLKLPDSKEEEGIILMIWDVMGQGGVRDLLQEGWFHGTHGIMMVCDVTNPETLKGLSSWKISVESVAGEVPSYLLANKSDLKDDSRLNGRDLKAFSDEWGCPYIFTSAKTGEGVEEAFAELATMAIRRQLPA